MAKRMLIDALHPEETRVVIADENQIYDFDFVSTAKKQLKGNIYLAKITRVEPSLQAAFVEYGGGKQGFLPFAEIHADYYQIPMSDRKRLMEEAQGPDEDDAEDADASQQSSSPGDSNGGDGNADSHSLSEQPAASTEFSPAPEAEQLAPATAENENDHPAYLMQGAIDVSTSEYVEMPEGADNIPMSQALAESEHTAAPVEHGPEGEQPTEEQQAEMPAGEQQQGESQSSEGVETLPNEEEEYRPKKAQFFKRYKIQEVIRRGQIVLVQVIKEERGNKGVSLTTYLSLAGRYCVLMPNSPKDGGISRKIASADDRKRLKSISTELRLATGMSVIIRTAGMDRTRAEIKRDYDYLVKLWNQIREDTLKSNAPALIYEESDIIKRAIRDQYTGDIDELIIEGDEGANAAREFMKLLLPSHTPKIKHYKGATPLFYAYNVEEQLLSMHDPVVKLRSGGYIVINPTEALISIDVNSGRATAERNIEETATKTNLEAAAEVARQLRLRDLAGLIVIDFIDMMESRNRRSVEKALKDSLKADRAKIQLGRISPFGLLEMSRQRLRPSISESNMVQCPHCIGRGYIRSNESMSIQMIRAIEKEASAGTWSSLRLIAPQVVALHLLNYKRDVLRAIELRYNLTVQVLIGTDIASSEFNLEKMRRAQSERGESSERRPPRRDRNDRPERGERPERPERNERPERSERNEPRDSSMSEEAGNDNFDQSDDNGSNITEVSDSPREGDGEGNNRNNRNRGRRRRGGRNRNDRPAGDRPAPVAATESDPSQQQDNVAEMGNAANEPFVPQEGAPDRNNSGRPPRTRGGRGRRRWRDRDERGGQNAGPKDGNQSSETQPQREEAYAVNTDGNTLPAFATEDRTSPPPAPEPVVASPALDTAPRNSDAPSRKGWWQKMIELDE